jgi:hypothetical protein
MCRPYIDTNKRSWHGLTTPFFSNFLFTNSFSITFLYFFIISSLFPYFNLFMSIFIQSYVNQILSSCLVIRLTYNDWSITNEQRTKSNLVSSQWDPRRMRLIQSVPITTNSCWWRGVLDASYSMQLITDLRKVSVYVLRFPQTKLLTTMM